MIWKPTEGLLRASSLAGEIHCVIMDAGGVITPVGRHGMVEMIARAIDQALRDGAEQDALDSVVGDAVRAEPTRAGYVVVPNGMLGDPQPDGATMMGGHPSSEYHSIIDGQQRVVAAKVAAAMPKKAKPRRKKKAKSKKAAKSASDKHSGDNPPTGD